MEDEDDVPKAVDPPTLEQAPSEAPLSEQPEIPEQCRASSIVAAPVEPPPVATTEGEAEPPPVAERLAGEGEGEVVEAVETDEREMEGVNDGEPEAIVEERDKLVQEGSEGEGNADEAVKVEELPQVTEDLGPKNEETGGEIEETAEQGTQTKESLGETEGDTVVEAEELLPVTEKVEVATTQDMAAQEVDKQEEDESKGVEGSSEGKEAAKQEEIESESVEGDVKGQVAVNEEEEGSKGDEEVFGEKAEDKHDIEGDGDGVLVIKQEEDDSKGGVGGDAEVQVMVNDEDNLSKPDEGMTVGMVEDEQELQGDGKEQLVEEQEEDESKGAGEDDVEGQVEVNEEEEEEEEEFKGDEEMEGEGEAEELNDSQVNDIASSPVVMKDEELTGEGEMPTADAEMEVEGEVVKSGSGGKRRRGRNSKAAPTRTPVRKTAGEDVCFICLDGGDLVLCDRRGCPKAYHPSCVDHDEEFFKTKDRWTCGWHLCNKCGKNAYFMCYTCTFSLCKGCCKGAVVFCVRGNKGFCESCMKTVMMIESTEQNEGQVAFDDKSSWEYLFKDYWIEQKRRFSITSDELAQARNPWKSSDATDKQQSGGDVHIGDNDVGTESDSTENLEVTDSKRKKGKRKSKTVDSDTDSSTEKDASTAKRKAKRKSKSQIKEAYSDSEHSSGNDDASNKKGKRPRRLSKSRGKDRNTTSAANIEVSAEGAAEWASKELLEFVMHMKDGDKSVLTQFDVQGLLLEYIKRNKLRDPRRRSQIICDPMLQKLFGKPRVGHFEMLKLLESHFLLKEDSQADDNHGSVVDEVSQVDADDNTDSTLEASRSKGRKSRKRGEDRGLPSNLDDYAAIDMHNINLIYLRRNLMEALMEDSEMFHDKVVGSFVRIRISGTNQKQDIYRLVQIIGTSKAAEPYRVGKRTTDVMLEILNLDKTEIISIDTISNQEFTEDECKRLRQSIKCGLISRMTVGDVLEKARELQEVRVTDWLEAEIVRLSHLRDRASEKGRKKELRECVEKLQLLKTPEERQRRLEEIPEVHADPKMDPSCESEDESEMDNRRQASIMRPRESGFFRRERDHFSSRKGSNDSWSANARPPNKNRELSRNSSGKGFSSRREDTIAASQTYEPSWNNGVDKGTTGGWEKPRLTSDPVISSQTEYSGVRSDVSATASEASQPPSAGTLQADAKVNEAEKIWHYRDPTSKVQGPFSMSQLRKWSNTGYFPADLRIWKASRSEDDSILLTEALAGRFQKESPSVGLLSDVSSKPGNAPSSIENSRDSLHARGSEYGVRYDPSNLPSPTPGRTTAGWGGKQTSESKWSTSSPFRSNNQSQGGNERLPSPTPTSPASVPSAGRPHFSQQSKDSGMMGIKEENSTASIMATASVTNSAGQFLSIAVPGPVVSVNSGSINAQQIPSQSGGHAANQAFVPGDASMNLANLRPDANIAAQGFSNVVQPSAMQNPSVYNTQGWAPGSVPRPDIVNANMMASNSSSIASQVSYGQWPGAPVANQASSYSAGYPPPGNMASNFPAMPSQSAWRPTSTNMPWAGQPPQPMNPNMGWAEPPSAAAFGSPAGAMGQLAGATPGASAVPSGNTMSGWPGTGSAPAGGNVNPGWVAPSGNASTWGGDQNRRGSGGAQWNRQSSFGGGGGGGPGTPRGQGVCKFHENGHCKKGAACNYMHT